MIPFQRDGGTFRLMAQIPLPGRAPANGSDISAFAADLIDAVSGSVILADQALSFHTASQMWRSEEIDHADLEGYDYVHTRFKPTSTNELIQTFTTPPRAVADILKRQDEIQVAIAAAAAISQSEHDAILGAILALQVGGTKVVEIAANYPVIEITELTETIDVVSAPVSVEIALTQPVIEVSQSANVIEVLED